MKKTRKVVAATLALSLLMSMLPQSGYAVLAETNESDYVLDTITSEEVSTEYQDYMPPIGKEEIQVEGQSETDKLISEAQAEADENLDIGTDDEIIDGEFPEEDLLSEVLVEDEDIAEFDIQEEVAEAFSEWELNEAETEEDLFAQQEEIEEVSTEEVLFAASPSSIVPGAEGAGTQSDPLIVDTFAELKAGMESSQIRCIKLKSTSEMLPDTTAYAAAITVKGSGNTKQLTIEGTSVFTAKGGSTGIYDCLLYVPTGVNLTIGGNGSLVFRASLNNGFNAVIRNHGTCSISDVTLEGSFNTAVYGYAVVNRDNGKLTISSGTFKGITAYNGPGPYAAVRVDSGTVRITGGIFSSSVDERVSVAAGTNALAVNSSADCIVSGGTFSSGIYVQGGANISKILDEHCTMFNSSNEIVSSDQSRYNGSLTVTRNISAVNLTISGPEIGKTTNDMSASVDGGLSMNGMWWYPQHNASGGSMSSTANFEKDYNYSSAYRILVPSALKRAYDAEVDVTVTTGTVYKVNRVNASRLEVIVNHPTLKENFITFDVNGGSGSMSAVPAAVGTSYTLPACGFIAPDSQEFAGWKLPDGTVKSIGTPVTVTKDMKLTAQWKWKAGTPLLKEVHFAISEPLPGDTPSDSITVTTVPANALDQVFLSAVLSTAQGNWKSSADGSTFSNMAKSDAFTVGKYYKNDIASTFAIGMIAYGLGGNAIINKTVVKGMDEDWTILINGKKTSDYPEGTPIFRCNAISIASAKIDGLSNQTYTGAAFTPTPSVTLSGKTLKKDTDYTVAYSNNINVGKAIVTITGKGNYTGSKTAEFRILPKPEDLTRPVDELSPENPKDLIGVENVIIGANNDKDVAGSSYSLLQLTATAKKKSVTLKWKTVPGATSYIIYGNKCGKKNRYQKIAEITGKKYTQKRLTPGTYYKYLVVAVKGSDAVAASKNVHVATKGGKFGNTTKVTLNKKKVTLKLNKAKKKKFKAVATYRNGSLKVKNHRKVAWESSDIRVATVNKKGKIMAVGKGTCYVYAYAQNGKMAKLKVTVK